MKAAPASRVRIKICGITNREDAEAAIAAGADALGFNTWREGKRFIDLDAAAAWIEELPPFITKVALLVNASLPDAERLARLRFVDALQLHGDEDAAYCAQVRAFGRPFIKALRLRSRDELSHLSEFGTRHFLIDAHVAGSFGGTGALADLAVVEEFKRQHPGLALTLAGGLTPENVAEVVRTVRPYAVDVSSGVESEPGRKDPRRMKAFVEAVRSAEKE